MNPVACEDPAKLGPKVSCLSLLTPNTWVLAKWTQYITNTLTSRPKHLFFQRSGRTSGRLSLNAEQFGLDMS